MNELLKFSATKIVQGIREGKFTPLEVVDAHIAQIGSFHPTKAHEETRLVLH